MNVGPQGSSRLPATPGRERRRRFGWRITAATEMALDGFSARRTPGTDTWAVRLSRQAAEQGNADAQSLLGYSTGAEECAQVPCSHTCGSASPWPMGRDKPRWLRS